MRPLPTHPLFRKSRRIGGFVHAQKKPIFLHSKSFETYGIVPYVRNSFNFFILIENTRRMKQIYRKYSI